MKKLFSNFIDKIGDKWFDIMHRKKCENIINDIMADPDKLEKLKKILKEI
jgi:hypothetical protein